MLFLTFAIIDISTFVFVLFFDFKSFSNIIGVTQNFIFAISDDVAFLKFQDYLPKGYLFFFSFFFSLFSFNESLDFFFVSWVLLSFDL